MKGHFEQLATYNRWNNARLYDAALALTDADHLARSRFTCRIFGTRTASN